MLTRDELLNLAWGWDFDGTDRVIDGHVKKLRRALGPHADCIKTVVKRGLQAGGGTEMKTKPKNFGNFFVRVGAGFLAFWLVTMGAFSLLLGRRRAQLMMAGY